MKTSNKIIIRKTFSYLFAAYFLLTGILVSRADVFAYGLGTGEACTKDAQCDMAMGLSCFNPPGFCAPPGSGASCQNDAYCENNILPKNTMRCLKIESSGYCIPKEKIPTNLDLNTVEEDYRPKTPTKPVESLKFTPQISIPNSYIQGTVEVGYSSGTKMMSDLLPQYVGNFYRYGLSIVGLIATVTLMGGGILWLTSMGNDSKIAKAKEMIFGSLTGVALLYGSYLILNTINPELIQLRPVESPSIAKVVLDNVCCLESNGQASMMIASECTKKGGKRFSGDDYFAGENKCFAKGCCITAQMKNAKNEISCVRSMKSECESGQKNNDEGDTITTEYDERTCYKIPQCSGGAGKNW